MTDQIANATATATATESTASATESVQDLPECCAPGRAAFLSTLSDPRDQK